MSTMPSTVHWTTDGDFYFAYADQVYTGYWIHYDGNDYSLLFETRPQAHFAQLTHAMDAAEQDLNR